MHHKKVKLFCGFVIFWFGALTAHRCRYETMLLNAIQCKQIFCNFPWRTWVFSAHEHNTMEYESYSPSFLSVGISFSTWAIKISSLILLLPISHCDIYHFSESFLNKHRYSVQIERLIINQFHYSNTNTIRRWLLTRNEIWYLSLIVVRHVRTSTQIIRINEFLVADVDIYEYVMNFEHE